MKTRTNFRKAAVRSAAVVVSFILISFTVSAQEFWKKLLTNSSFNEIAIAMIEPGKGGSAIDNSRINEADWKQFDRAFDPALELEGWMSSEEHFGLGALYNEQEADIPSAGQTGLMYLDYSPDASEPLNLEAWMIDNGAWIK